MDTEAIKEPDSPSHQLLLRALEAERNAREESEFQAAQKDRALAALLERQRLLERLSRIQRSISHRRPLQEVLDSITKGAWELIRDEVVGLRMIDHDDPDQLILVSHYGIKPALLPHLLRGPVGVGAGGRAITEGDIVVIEDYQKESSTIGVLASDDLQAAMATPVHENGRIVGSLAVASYIHGRTYSEMEREVLRAFAEHASLALTDAKTVEAMREAQRAKDMFLAMVSHELKTPLTVVMGSVRTLQSYGATLAPEVRDQLLDTVFNRGRELEVLINRLLQGARAELAGAVQDVRLPDAVTAAVDALPEGRRIKIAPIPDVWFRSDPSAVREIVGILLENAVSHSPSTTAIDVLFRQGDEKVEVTVCNVGSLPPGVKAHELFQAFHRGEDAHASGIGLGLYIAERLATSIGCTLTASEKGGRVRFTLSLPTIASPAPSEPARLAV